MGTALVDHILESTRSSYSTAATQYIQFCEIRAVDPWPVDPIWFCAWLLLISKSVLHTSLKMYMAGVRSAQELEGWTWKLNGHGVVRRTIRWIRRRYPVSSVAPKMAISTSLLRAILPHIPGWPVAGAMSHDDRLFAAASVIGVMGFLRGGEFLAYPGSGRPTLQFCKVKVRDVAGVQALVVHIVQPKTKWWLDEVLVPLFGAPDDTDFCPVRLWLDYVANADQPFSSGGPALRQADGSSLSRSFMIARTAALMAAAGISCVNPEGENIEMRASSWRAGGVRSAIDAGVPESMVMALGRWKSAAWMHYLVQTPVDFCSASRSLWRAVVQPSAPSQEMRVGVCDTSAFFVSEAKIDESEVKQIMLSSRPPRTTSIPLRYR